LRNDIFEDAAILCQRVNKQVGDIFSNPETVLAKLIQNVFEIKLQVILNVTNSTDLKSVCDIFSRIFKNLVI
jgi:hypothetical protein